MQPTPQTTAERGEQQVTVIMPFTDRLDYFETYYSAGHWEGLPLQLVCDGSTPETVAELERLAGLDTRTRIHVKHERGGVAGARSTGAHLTRTPYCLYCDDDDFIVDAKAAVVEAAELLKDDGVLFCTTPFVFVLGHDSQYHVQYDRTVCDGMTGEQLLQEMAVTGEMLALGAGTVFRTDLVRSSAADSIFKVSEDYVSVARMAAAHPHRRIRVLSRGAYMRLIHKRSLSRGRTDAQLLQHIVSMFVAAWPLVRTGHMTRSQLSDILVLRGEMIAKSWGRGKSAAAWFAAAVGGNSPPEPDAEAAFTREWVEKVWSQLPPEFHALVCGRSGEVAGKKLPTPEPSVDSVAAESNTTIESTMIATPPPAVPAEAPFMDAHEVSALTACLASFDRPVRALEWGSGTSTRYFSERLPIGSTWQSIEHHAEWAQAVQGQLRAAGLSHVDVHYVPNNAPFQDGVEDGDYADFRNYVRFGSRLGGTFDFVLVDGRARVECLRQGWSLMPDDGVMVLHDAHRREYHIGLPTDGWLVRMVNASVNNGEGPATLFFIGRSKERMRDLVRSLSAAVPLAIEGPMPTSEVRENGRVTAPHGVFLNTFHRGFLAEQYQVHPHLASASYADQHAALQATRFGDSDFYSAGLRAAGWSAEDLIINADPVQAAWARENGFRGDLQAIAVEQVRRIRPDMVYVQDMNHVNRDFLLRLRPWARLLVGQIATTVATDIPFEKYDIVMSSFPHYADEIRRGGKTAYYQPLAFDPRVSALIREESWNDRKIPFSFVGGISSQHRVSMDLLNGVTSASNLEFWGYGAEGLPPDSPIRKRHHGAVWGRDMFQVLADSRITLNRHSDDALNYANNMRLFEATGCGALLLTDYKDNLNDLFEIGRECVAFRTPEEAAALAKYYLAHPDEATEIAEAGRQRTLRDHTYAQRMARTAEILNTHLRHQEERYHFAPVDHSKISTGKSDIEASDVTESLTKAWQDPQIPARQRALTRDELEAMYRGETPGLFTALAELVKPAVRDGSKVLEVGCATGYYSEILSYLLNRPIAYTGADYSAPLIEMARDYYPNARFDVAEGAALPYEDAAFDVVVTSAVLMHVENYLDHIAEAARVADGLLIAHRTPVRRGGPTRRLRKLAYGVETLELVFEEDEILAAFAAAGWRESGRTVLSADPERDEYVISYAFVPTHAA